MEYPVIVAGVANSGGKTASQTGQHAACRESRSALAPGDFGTIDAAMPGRGASAI
jgi:hypothetical protein